MKARGIWATLLSKPDDWQVYVSQLVKTCRDGKASIYSGLKELKEAGYLEHVFVRDDGGKMMRGEYIVHEEPIEVKPPVNTEPEPYTENRNTVNRDTENPPLLKTKDKLKTDDDKTATPQDQTEPVDQEPKKNSSPSFSENEKIKILAGLYSLIPEHLLKQSVKRTIEKALTTHSMEYVKNAILYTNAGSNGDTWQKYKAYLGKCIENNWHDGWTPDQGQVDQTAIVNEFRKMQDNVLQLMADAGNKFAVDELDSRAKK